MCAESAERNGSRWPQQAESAAQPWRTQVRDVCEPSIGERSRRRNERRNCSKSQFDYRPRQDADTDMIRVLFGSVAVPLINVVIGAIAAVVVWPIYPAWVILAWMGALIRRHCIQAGAMAAVPAATTRRGNHCAVGIGFTLASIITGCLWGLLASTVFVTSDPVYIVFAAFVLGGMCAGAATHNSPHLPAYYGFVVPAVLPIIAALLTRGTAMPDRHGPDVAGLRRSAHYRRSCQSCGGSPTTCG